jgi:hypothetical protein
MDEKTKMVLDMALIGLQPFYNDTDMSTIQKVESELWAVAEKAVQIAAYLEGRWYFRMGHDRAVKYSNHKVTEVRKAIGYSQARQDINF